MYQVHLAVLHDWALAKILSGKKTIESRFNKVRIAPFGRCAAGDMVLLKRAGGKIVGTARVSGASFHEGLADGEVRALVDRHQAKLGFGFASGWFKGKTKYISLIRLVDVRPCAPFAFPKKDRSAWKILAPESLSAEVRAVLASYV